MSRPLRIQYKGAIYHISARGNEKKRVFWEKIDYEYFLKLLEKACERFSLRVYSFVLMTNHCHLMLRTEEANLSKAMHWLKTGYTVYLNRRRKRVGHLFQGRYHSVIVENESHFLELSRYIHLNPVRAHMVKRPEDYEWSSCRDYLRQRQKYPWVDRDAVLSELGGAANRRHTDYRKFLYTGANLDDSALNRIRQAIVLGSDVFREGLRKKYAPEKKPDVLGTNRLSQFVPIKQAQDRINKFLARRHPKYENNCSVQMYLLYRMGYGLKDVGTLFDVSYSAVSQNARRNAEKYDAEIDVCSILSNVKR